MNDRSSVQGDIRREGYEVALIGELERLLDSEMAVGILKFDAMVVGALDFKEHGVRVRLRSLVAELDGERRRHLGERFLIHQIEWIAGVLLEALEKPTADD